MKRFNFAFLKTRQHFDTRCCNNFMPRFKGCFSLQRWSWYQSRSSWRSLWRISTPRKTLRSAARRGVCALCRASIPLICCPVIASTPAAEHRTAAAFHFRRSSNVQRQRRWRSRVLRAPTCLTCRHHTSVPPPLPPPPRQMPATLETVPGTWAAAAVSVGGLHRTGAEAPAVEIRGALREQCRRVAITRRQQRSKRSTSDAPRLNGEWSQSLPIASFSGCFSWWVSAFRPTSFSRWFQKRATLSYDMVIRMSTEQRRRRYYLSSFCNRKCVLFAFLLHKYEYNISVMK